MAKEQQLKPPTDSVRLKQSYNKRRDSERPVPYSVAKAYRLLIAAREDTQSRH